MSDESDTLSVRAMNKMRYGLNHEVWDKNNYLDCRLTFKNIQMPTKEEVRTMLRSGRLVRKNGRTYLDTRIVKGLGAETFHEIILWCST